MREQVADRLRTKSALVYNMIVGKNGVIKWKN